MRFTPELPSWGPVQSLPSPPPGLVLEFVKVVLHLPPCVHRQGAGTALGPHWSLWSSTQYHGTRELVTSPAQGRVKVARRPGWAESSAQGTLPRGYLEGG